MDYDQAWGERRGAAWWPAQLREIRIESYRRLAGALVRQAVRRWFLRMLIVERLHHRIHQLQRQGD